MHKSKRYLAVAIAITIVFIANTVNVAFSPILLTEAESTQEFSADKDSMLSPTRPDKGFYSRSKEMDNGKPQSSFQNLWGLDSFDKDSRFDGTEERRDLACFDEDSAELVIGVNSANAEAYTNLVDEVIRSQGRIVNTVSIEGEVIAVVADMPLTTISLFTEKVQANNLARYVEPNMRFQTQFVPNDPYWSLQWGPQKIEADWAWNTTTGNSSILVAVIDTGVDYTHSDLEGNYVALGYDWVNDDLDPLDDNGHGTHCAGIIAAALNNTVGIAGIANVSIMVEKGLDANGSGLEDDLANAIIHAVDQGADILSNSWGGYGESMLIHDAVQYAYNHSVLVIAAAGNDASSLKHYPAAYDEVVAVTATDSYDNPADEPGWGTNFGDWVEVAAPGVDIYSTMPTYHVTMNDMGYSMNYTYMSGTSMACPHVAGVAALIWSQFPNTTRDWVRAQLRYTADDLGDPGFDEYYGYGRINAKNGVEQAPANHDLLIFDWNRPQYVKLGESATFNITVLNFGASNETDVEVHLLVNSSSINSTHISLLQGATSTTVSLSWTPTSEGVHNVTYYVLPVPEETIIENNQITEILYVITPPPETNWMLLETDPDEDVGTNLESIYGQVHSDIVYFKVEHHRSWTTINDIDTAIFIDADQDASTGLPDGTYPYQDTDIGADYVIVVGWEATEMWKWDPIIGMWDISNPIPFAYLEAPENSDAFVVGVFLADVETSGIVDCAVADIPSNWDWMPNSGFFTWIVIQYEHELAVRLETPLYLLPEETSLLNATVYNRGLNNETNVEIQILINDTEVTSETLTELVNGTWHTINYSWTPTLEGVHNVTAYALPVPEENFTLNNIKTEFVSVHYPLINPKPGQYANYAMNYYDSSGHLIGSQGYFNLTYDYYIEPYKIYITVWQKDTYGYNYTGYMIVNTMTRLVESGDIWVGWWYLGWIETGIHIGSTINLMDGTATVNGTRIIVVGPQGIDCWEIPYFMYGYPYTFWYDKASGLWIKMESTDPYTGERIELLLIDTNVPIGTHYEHDLGVTLDAAFRLQPGETSMLNATVYNLGLNNETNVEIQILINDTEVTSETLTELVNGTWHTINYSWTPTVEGTYNITAYTPLVSGENVTINNIASTMVYVRYIEVALISDGSELMVITSILDSMGIGYHIYNDNSYNLYTEDLSLLLDYATVIFYQYNRLITSGEHSTLQSYLSSGGNLLVTGYDSLGSPSDVLLAEVVRSSSTGDNTGESDLYVVDSSHPIMNGPYGSFPAGHHISGLYSDCDAAEADTVRMAVTVAELADGYDKIIATEGLPGKVVYWNGIGPDDWMWNSDCEAMFKNLIHWFTVRYEHELIVYLEAPNFLEPGDSTLLNATVQNQGLNDETDVELQLSINSTIVKNVTIFELVNGTSYTMNYTWTPALAGTHNITVYAPPVPDENITTNNIYSKFVPVQYAPRILAYVQYTDYYQDYPNTLKAIESAFGPNYILTELWDYTQLDSTLDGKDILLIPDQEYASLYTMELIGTAWSETLTEFLENGGIVILCDGGYGYGGTYGILTGAELMSISSADYRSYYTLYLVDPSDPLAEGVSSSFVSPYYTVSFVTEDTNVVIEDEWHYPVVIHKEIGRGGIALLGFDFESPSADTEQLLGNAVALAAYIPISVNPSAGSPGTKVTVTGTKATANGTVSIYWDDNFMENITANEVGDFAYLMTVPSEATVGVHEILAMDIATRRAGSTPFRVILIALNPIEGPIGTNVTVNGAGFAPESQATITFSDMLIGYTIIDSSGNFTFTFNIPLSTAGKYYIKALDAEGNSACKKFTVVDITSLDVQIDVGAMHFLGEIAEFYAQTTFKGQAVNATITSAVLHKPDGTTEILTAQRVTTGLYRISYTIVGNETGTYTLVINAGYVTDTVQANGTAFKCFLVSDTLTLMNATLEDIFLKVIAINGTTATIQTTLGVMNGTITSIEGDIATIEIPDLGQIETDISNLKETQEAWIIPQYAILIIALIAAANSTLSVILLIRKKTTKTE